MRINIKTLRYSKLLAVTLIIRYNLYKTFLFWNFLYLAITLKKVIFEPFTAFPAGQTNYTVTSWREIDSAGLFDLMSANSVLWELPTFTGYAHWVIVSFTFRILRRELGCFKKPGVYNEGKEEPDHLYRNFLFKLLVDWSFVATNWTMGKRLCVCLFIESPESFRTHALRVTY